MSLEKLGVVCVDVLLSYSLGTQRHQSPHLLPVDTPCLPSVRCNLCLHAQDYGLTYAWLSAAETRSGQQHGGQIYAEGDDRLEQRMTRHTRKHSLLTAASETKSTCDRPIIADSRMSRASAFVAAAKCAGRRRQSSADSCRTCLRVRVRACARACTRSCSRTLQCVLAEF